MSPTTISLSLSSANVGDKEVQSLDQENPLEEEMATHSSILTWRIPWTEEPGAGYWPWGRKESDTTERLHFHFHALEKEMATHSSILAWRIPGTVQLLLWLPTASDGFLEMNFTVEGRGLETSFGLLQVVHFIDVAVKEGPGFLIALSRKHLIWLQGLSKV